jgi:porin
VGVFKDGAEFFTFAQLDGVPSTKDRYLKNMHVTFWHVDEREEAAVPSSKGVAFGANWTFYKKFMPFIRAGCSDGDAPLMNKTATVGFIHRFHKSDLLGLVEVFLYVWALLLLFQSASSAWFKKQKEVGVD